MVNKELEPESKFLQIAEALVRDARGRAADYSAFKSEVQQELSALKTILENHVTLAPWHAAQIRKAVGTRIRHLLPDDGLYNRYSKRFYSALWRDLKTAFHVAEYREIPRVRFDAAMAFIISWYPTAEIINQAG
ncbi:MAG: ORF6C domain-containing protein [Negativicutes bacterium]|nr:ORF6C domain-containing protein [Negativicutes bacterium]